MGTGPRHLIHVGYPKAGTHFLQRWFAANPHILYAHGGLAGYRSVYDLADAAALPAADPAPAWRITSSETLVAPLEYLSTRRVGAPHEHASAEAQAAACETLASIYPDAHILIVTRGFRAMLFSSYSQAVRAGGDMPFSLLQNARAEDSWKGEHAWNYDHLVSLYREAFNGRVILLPYELLRDDPAAFVNELSAALSIPPFAGDSGRVYESLSPAELAWLPGIARLVHRAPLPQGAKQKLFDAYKKRIGGRALRSLARTLQKLSPRPGPSADMIPEDVVSFFRGHARSFAALPLYQPYRDEYLLAD
jgi:hypothetical protein